MPPATFTASHGKQNRQADRAAPLNKQHGEEKENVSSAHGWQEEAANDDPFNALASGPKLPQTPGRISLSDLVANPEDLLNQLPAATPCEQVTWKQVPGLLRSPPSSMKTTQRSRKRGHSSSPASSQSRRLKPFRGDDEELDMKSISQSLNRSPSRRSPNQDDPVTVLWNNYAHGRGYEPILPPIPAFDLSPQTSNDGKKDGFRRTASCSNEWPTSVKKRRKMNQQDPHSTTKQIFASRRKDMLKTETSSKSKVSILLESVQQSILARQREVDEPSSSSPLPERIDAEDAPRQAVHEPTAAALSPQQLSGTNTVLRNGGSPLKQQAQESSDYGDLDFDEDDLEDIEKALTQGQMAQDPASNLVALKNPQVQTASIGGSAPQIHARQTSTNELEPQNSLHAPQQEKQSPHPLDDDFDDFDDDDAFENELQQLADKVDSQQHSLPTALQGQGLPTTSLSKACDGTFDDDYDENVFDAMPVKVQAGSKCTTLERQTQSDNRAIKRYLIIDVLESIYTPSNGKKRPQKMLSIKDEKSKKLFVIFLRQSWYETRCIKGAYLHLIGEFNHQGHCIVDDTQNMMIIHPDHLISATVIGDAITCLRRAVLQDRVKATSPPQKPQVYGHIIHEVFGEALRVNDWNMSTFQAIIERILPNYLEDLYEIGVSVPHATEHLMSKVSHLKAWAELFVAATIQPAAEIRDRNGVLVPAAINKLLEVEEHVWSPMYGLKGNIDATVQAQIKLPGELLPKNLVAPLELKTGAKDNNESHRAQTALYTLLLSDRYDVEVTSGILYYMETSKTFRIEGIRNEIRQMIIWRNLLASYVHDKLELPPMTKRDHICKRCYAQTSCFTYHKLAEDGSGESSGLKEMFEEAVSHLQPHHQSFFKRWDDLLTKEERDFMKFRRELWTMLSTEREQVGRCFANVVIEPGSASENVGSSKINRFTYCFTKHNTVPGFSFTESQITVGEPIVISDEKGHFALANGYVTHVRPQRITVAVDRRLQNARKRTKDFDPEKNQSFVGIMEVTVDGIPRSSAAEDDTPILYRIDKDEFSNGMATIRNNLIRMMEKDLFKARELRELIVDRKAPTFKPNSTAYSLSGPASQANVNVDQRAAIDKVMSAKDYALVLGMPGTGKTTTIAHIIRALVSQGKSVLLTSYTHTAVDNILLKIKDDNIPVLRLGSTGKVHPDVRGFADLSGVPKTSMEELERSWQNSKVVATTCLSINHGIFNHRIFDYCIVDEASQITLPVCLGPIRMAHTFILVGDHYQLPPLVQNKEAQEGGLDISLFKLLSDTQPDAVVNLEHQYRMAEDIMLLSNELIYSGRLKCGTSSVATRALKIPSLQNALDAHHHRRSSTNSSQAPTCTPSNANCWFRIALAPANRALFLNTDSISLPQPATEVLTGSNQRITNPVESILTAQLVTTLVRSGVAPKSIGVITFYRSQLALLRRDVKAVAGTNTASEVEMHTADKYQGRDKEVIILSCVRNNPARNVGELLKDWRRVNVAITRARSKMIILGSQRTLEGSQVPVLEGLVRIMNEKGWIYNLPANATEGHVFVTAMPTQTQLGGQTEGSRDGTLQARTEQRRPLTTISANVSRSASQKHENTPQPLWRSAKTTAPFKQPKKVVKGTVNVGTLLEKSPMMKDVASEVAAAKENVPVASYDFDDLNDDDMLIEF